MIIISRNYDVVHNFYLLFQMPQKHPSFWESRTLSETKGENRITFKVGVEGLSAWLAMHDRKVKGQGHTSTVNSARMAYRDVVVASVVEYAGVGNSYEYVVQQEHYVVDNGEADEQKWRGRQKFVVYRPEHDRRHRVACKWTHLALLRHVGLLFVRKPYCPCPQDTRQDVLGMYQIYTCLETKGDDQD